MRKLLILAILLMPFFVSAQTDVPSTELTTDQKIAIYAQIKKELAVPIIMNTVVGFGTGSFSQMDILGGSIGLILDTTGFVFLSIGANYSLSTIYQERSNSYLPLIIGLVEILGARTYLAFRAVSYCKYMNKQILKYLKLQDPAMIMSISLSPEKSGISLTQRF